MRRADALFAREDCLMKTAVATIGIRGTKYDGRRRETDCGEGGRCARVHDGGIRMCQEAAKTQACRPGTRINIPTGYDDGKAKGLTRAENNMRAARGPAHAARGLSCMASGLSTLC